MEKSIKKRDWFIDVLLTPVFLLLSSAIMFLGVTVEWYWICVIGVVALLGTYFYLINNMPLGVCISFIANVFLISGCFFTPLFEDIKWKLLSNWVMGDGAKDVYMLFRIVTVNTIAWSIICFILWGLVVLFPSIYKNNSPGI